MGTRAAMELSALLETLSLAPLSAERGGAESPGLWSLRPADASPPAVGRSASLVEARSRGRVPPPPPPGFAPLPAPPPAPASRYKTELCRTFSESGRCRYGAKCQFAHGPGELRPASRHPKYKTEPCRKFFLQGRCPYGARCHFIHGPGEAPAAPPLRHSLSCSGPAPARSPPPAAPGAPGPACCPSCRRAGLWGPVGSLARSPSAHSLGSDPDDYGSSGSSLGGSESPVFEAGAFGPPLGPAPPRRLPIFNRISVSE